MPASIVPQSGLLILYFVKWDKKGVAWKSQVIARYLTMPGSYYNIN